MKSEINQQWKYLNSRTFSQFKESKNENVYLYNLLTLCITSQMVVQAYTTHNSCQRFFFGGGDPKSV